MVAWNQYIEPRLVTVETIAMAECRRLLEMQNLRTTESESHLKKKKKKSPSDSHVQWSLRTTALEILFTFAKWNSFLFYHLTLILKLFGSFSFKYRKYLLFMASSIEWHIFSQTCLRLSETVLCMQSVKIHCLFASCLHA